MTPYFDDIPWSFGSEARISTTAKFTGKLDDCTLAALPLYLNQNADQPDKSTFCPYQK
jgi:hypothetical protein